MARLFMTFLVVAQFANPGSAQTNGKQAPWTPDLMMQVKRIGNVQVSPNGKQVVYAVRAAVMTDQKSEYLTHLHLANADGSGTVQLTQGEKSCDEPQWSPDGSAVAFLTNRSGKRNIWVLPSQGGEARPLTNHQGGVHSFKWSPDGQAIAFTAADAPTAEEIKAAKEKNDARVIDENVKMNRLYVVASHPPVKGLAKARLLTTKNYSVGNAGARSGLPPFDWAPDGKTLVFSHTRTPFPDDWPSADLSLVAVESGTVTSLVHSGAAEYAPLFSPDGKWIAFAASDNPPTWAGAGRINVIAAKGGKPRELADTLDGFGRYSEMVGWSPDGDKIYFTEVQGTTLKLAAMPMNGSPVVITRAKGMASSGIHLNATRTMVGFSRETLEQPPEAFISPADQCEPMQVSRVNAEFGKRSVGRTEILQWKSPDGLAIEGLLTYPAHYEKGKRYPLLLVIHGGPMGVFTEQYVGAAGLYPVAAFADRGYAVLRPNPRGSSGYGKKFRYANYGDWGKGDYQDIMAGVDQVIDLGIADKDRLGVMGWSYGGYMTSWTITQTRRFKAASVGAGVTNLMSFTGTADIPGFLPDYFAREFWDDLKPYQAHSAMFHVKGVKTPTLIQHGERDERVPLPQGQELYNALKRQGCTTKMVVYPRTPHGIEEPRLMIDCMTRNLDWFAHYVK